MSSKDIDFMSELEAAVRMKPSRPAILMLVTISLFIVFFLFWAAVTEVEEVTRGQGQVVPTQEIQTVQSLEGGILQELLIAEGDSVTKGQVLLRISDVHFSSEERGTEAQFFSLRAKKIRLKAEVEGEDFVMLEDIAKKMPQVAANEKALYDSRQRELSGAYSILDDRISKAEADMKEVSADINRLYQSRKLLKKELAITKDMVAQRAVPKLDQIRLERELADISGQINTKTQERKGLEADLSATQNERSTQGDKFRSQSLEELGDVEARISSLQENLKSMEDRVYRTDVRAPVDGVVNKIALKTIGGVIEPAMRLVEIVPLDDALKIIAKVKPDEIAFLHPDQPVKVKVTAYDPQKYGSLDGVLKRIGANSVKDSEGESFFEIEIVTSRNFMGSADQPLPITPGMVADIEVITGKRTILNYLIKPIRRGFDRALRER